MTAREQVLLRGLVDWVALDRIHWEVAQENKEQPLAVVQSQTLQLVRELLDSGLFEVGDLSGDAGRFVAWGISVDQAVDRIADSYVTNFDERNDWPWICWFDLTEAGIREAESIELRSKSPSGGFN